MQRCLKNSLLHNRQGTHQRCMGGELERGMSMSGHGFAVLAAGRVG
jgi:hypothetical protein